MTSVSTQPPKKPEIKPMIVPHMTPAVVPTMPTKARRARHKPGANKRLVPAHRCPSNVPPLAASCACAAIACRDHASRQPAPNAHERDENDEDGADQGKAIAPEFEPGALRARYMQQLIGFELRDFLFIVLVLSYKSHAATPEQFGQFSPRRYGWRRNPVIHSECADLHRPSITSVSRLASTTDAAISKHAPCTTGKSRPTDAIDQIQADAGPGEHRSR